MAREKPASAPITPQPGEEWDFKFGRAGGPFAAKQIYPPAKVIEVANGWVRYALGKAHPDLKKPVATFTHLYYRLDA